MEKKLYSIINNYEKTQVQKAIWTTNSNYDIIRVGFVTCDQKPQNHCLRNRFSRINIKPLGYSARISRVQPQIEYPHWHATQSHSSFFNKQISVGSNVYRMQYERTENLCFPSTNMRTYFSLKKPLCIQATVTRKSDRQKHCSNPRAIQ